MSGLLSPICAGHENFMMVWVLSLTSNSGPPSPAPNIRLHSYKSSGTPDRPLLGDEGGTYAIG